MKNFALKNIYKRSFLIAALLYCTAVLAHAQAPAKPKAKPASATKAPAKTKAAATDTTTKTTAAAAAPAVAATPKTTAGILETFFKKYKDDGTAAAIDYLFGTNKYFTNTAGITQLKSKLDSLRQGIGSYLGRDLISQRQASNSLVSYSYLVKHEIQPIRFTFMFYKAQNEWALYRFKYDDQMDAELEEAGKINSKHP
ncbi:MAG TPA: hypothetical protein VIM55_09295 [Mucilaginibacter sp.]